MQWKDVKEVFFMVFLDFLYNEKTIIILLGISLVSAVTALVLSFSVKKPSISNLYRKTYGKQEELQQSDLINNDKNARITKEIVSSVINKKQPSTKKTTLRTKQYPPYGPLVRAHGRCRQKVFMRTRPQKYKLSDKKKKNETPNEF